MVYSEWLELDCGQDMDPGPVPGLPAAEALLGRVLEQAAGGSWFVNEPEPAGSTASLTPEPPRSWVLPAPRPPTAAIPLTVLPPAGESPPDAPPIRPRRPTVVPSRPGGTTLSAPSR
ncbi:MAG TPA: hypothetical protein VK280_23085 [Streptosporangiaceae bacterium]|nr:hypothetical protein [Streptosporangiaceae bacterium]